MFKNLQYLFLIAATLFLQGCISHNVQTPDLTDIKDYREFMISNQNFNCRNAFAGGAHIYKIKKGDLLRAYKLPENTEIRGWDTEGGIVDSNMIFLKYNESFGYSIGFLVFPDGSFVHKGKDQLGVTSHERIEIMVACKWEGITPFEPLDKQRYEIIKNIQSGISK